MTLPRLMPARMVRTACAICVLALGTGSSSAVEGGFTATLSRDQQTAAGLSTLTAPEQAALDRLVADELARLRAGDAKELAGTFVSRRTAAERKLAGLDRLTPDELAKLDELAAATFSARPKPKERPRLKEDDVISAKNQPEIHGAVSLTYGWAGGGHNYRATSLWVDYFDPATGLELGFGMTNFTGRGFYDYYPGEYGSRYYYPGPAYYQSAGRNPMLEDFSRGTGQSFQTAAGWDSVGRDRRRH